MATPLSAITTPGLPDPNIISDWQYDPQSRQFYSPSAGKWGVAQTYGTNRDTGEFDPNTFGTWGIGDGTTSYGALLGNTQATKSGQSGEQLYGQFGKPGYVGPGIYSNAGGTLQRLGDPNQQNAGGLTGSMFVNPNAGQWPVQKVVSKEDSLLGGFDPLALGLLGLYAGGFGMGWGGGGGVGGVGPTPGGAGTSAWWDFGPGSGTGTSGTLTGAGGGFGGPTGGSMAFDINDPSTWFSDPTGGENSAWNAGNTGGSVSGTPDWGSLDAGPGATPVDPTSAKAYADALKPGLWERLMQQVGNNPLSAARLIGQLFATGLGAYGSSQQARSLANLANTYANYGAPSRARFEASMTPGFDPMNIPGYAGALDTASKGILARLSATGGNPFGNPGGLIDANKQIVAGTALPAIQEFQRLNAGTGFGTTLTSAIPLQTAAIGQQGNVLNSLGYGINAITNPQPSLADLLKSLNVGALA